jgi:hypothetical protein
MLINDCGWKGGDSGNKGKERIMSNRQETNFESKNVLTETGLLMEGDVATLRRLFAP